MRCTLYGRSDCHLCEVARAELQPLVRNGMLQLEYCDIDSRDDLPADYATRIPLLRTESGREYGWPFRAAEVLNAPR